MHERMSQGTGVKGVSEKKKMPGWSIGEMKEKLSVAEEDAGEVTKCSGLSESEMDQSWKKLAGRMEEDVLDKYNVEESNKEVTNGRSASLGWRRVRKNKTYRMKEWREDCWSRILSVWRIQLAASAKQAGGVNGRRREDLIRKIRSKGRMDAGTDGGSRSCWQRTVKKRGLMQDGKMLCMNGTNGWNT